MRKKLKREQFDEAVRMMAERCIAVQLRLLTRAISKIYNSALRDFDVTVSQMNILVAVSYMRQAKQQDVCDALLLDRSSLSRDIERLLARDWLSARPGDDARTSLLALTAKGRRLLEEIIPAWETAQREASELIGPEHQDAMIQSTKAIRRNRQTVNGEWGKSGENR